MDGPGHLLSLKVMRVSRPALGTAWEPFYSSSPSFSAHSTALVLSLQGKTPLEGHPKTLRDLTNASELLTLPSSFGAIQLGETFSGALAVNNETAASIDGVLLRIEMQTATNKVLLVELGGPIQTLAPGDTMETVVNHEIKELGQHVLACTVSYRSPPGARLLPVPAETGGDPNVQTFRKFYKFAVTNPLSVKTKVHVPRSPSANLSRTEREKVFLEIHIQNLTPEPMWFERMVLDPAPGWEVQDANQLASSKSSSSDETSSQSLFSGSMAMMQPQDARQYIYILTATSIPTFAIQPAPGTVIPLGRLDISWRSSFGEPGRLLTSMLSRRIPLIPPSQATAPRHHPASALPLHLQRSNTVASSSQPPSRPSTPPIGVAPPIPIPYRPASPRTRPMSISPRPQTPVTFTAAANAMISVPFPPHIPDPLDIDFVVLDIPQGPVKIDKPFTVRFSLGVSTTLREGRRRVVSLAVQHVQPPSSQKTAVVTPSVPPIVADVASPRVSHASLGSVVSAQISRANSQGPILDDRQLVNSPRQHRQDGDPTKGLPCPEPERGDEARYAKVRGARFLGPSVQILPPVNLLSPVLSRANDGDSDDEVSVDTHDKTPKVEGFTEFEMKWIPVQTGFVRVGGVRVLVVEDWVEEMIESRGGGMDKMSPRTLKEWDVVGELWVTS
ncbi:hypothetical protein OF83DRAFT_1059760 [Amylostereum chailletii]|nr:hypothetical protein OF83DRAFT_1059760 [Amylostereum chailletii]